MAEFQTEIDENQDYTLRTVTGVLHISELQAAVEEYYAGIVTQLILWDVRQAAIEQLSHTDMLAFARRVKELSAVRKGGKSAFVVSGGLLSGISEILLAMGESEGLEYEQRVFTDIEEAKRWLGVKD